MKQHEYQEEEEDDEEDAAASSLSTYNNYYSSLSSQLEWNRFFQELLMSLAPSQIQQRHLQQQQQQTQSDSTNDNLNRPTPSPPNPFLSNDPLPVPTLIEHFRQLVDFCVTTPHPPTTVTGGSSGGGGVASSAPPDAVPLSSTDHLCVLAESLGNYLAIHLDPPSFEQFTHRINAATTNWLHHFLRLPPTTKGYYRATQQSARLLLTKLALLRHYPMLPSLGFLAFQETIPLIFASRDWFWLEEVRFDLGLPIKSILIFRDASHLRSLLEEFTTESSGVYRPFMLVVSTGGWRDHFEGDDIKEYITISRKYNMWFHVEGAGLLALTASPDTTTEDAKETLIAIRNADSILFNALTLFGYPDENKMVPTVFYRNEQLSKSMTVMPYLESDSVEPTLPIDPTTSSVASSGTPLESPITPITTPTTISSTAMRAVDHGTLTLQLWFVFQFIGKEKLRSNIDNVLSLCSLLQTSLSVPPLSSSVSIVTPPYATTQVMFQYVPLKTDLPKDANNLSPYSQEILSPPFVVKANQLLFNWLQHSLPLHLDITLVNRNGSHYILFSPLFSPNFSTTTMDKSDMEGFVCNLKLAIESIETTLRQKDAFHSLVGHRRYSSQGLYSVSSVPLLVGLGAVRYIPPLLLTGQQCGNENDSSGGSSSSLLLGKSLQEEIDTLNQNIATKLSSLRENSIYQLGKDSNQSSCIILRVDLTAKTPFVFESCQTYLEEILTTAQAVEQEFEFSKQVGKIVEIGIKEAEERLKKENERIEAEQGLIRKIPVVGSVLNWMLPYKTNQTRGNSFNLLTTVISDPSTTLKPLSTSSATVTTTTAPAPAPATAAAAAAAVASVVAIGSSIGSASGSDAGAGVAGAADVTGNDGSSDDKGRDGDRNEDDGGKITTENATLDLPPPPPPFPYAHTPTKEDARLKIEQQPQQQQPQQQQQQQHQQQQEQQEKGRN